MVSVQVFSKDNNVGIESCEICIISICVVKTNDDTLRVYCSSLSLLLLVNYKSYKMRVVVVVVVMALVC